MNIIHCAIEFAEEYREKNKIISSLTNLFSTSQDTLLERAQQLKNTNQEIKLLRLVITATIENK